MPRYFLSTNASRNYISGGRSFEFEPIALRGGSWFGVLALDEESDANILLSAGFPQVDEIDFATYDAQKKKVETREPSTFQNSLPRPNPVGLAVAPVVGQSSAPGGAPDLSKDPNSTSHLSAVSLMSGSVTPPHEPLLEQPATRRPRPNR